MNPVPTQSGPRTGALLLHGEKKFRARAELPKRKRENQALPAAFLVFPPCNEQVKTFLEDTA